MRFVTFRPLKYLSVVSLVAPAALCADPTPAPASIAPGVVRRVTLAVTAYPLRQALTRLAAAAGETVEIEESVPDVLVTADVRNVPFSTAMRCLLRASGIPGLKATVTESYCGGDGSAAVLVSGGVQRIVGVSVGPNGVQVPNVSSTSLQSLRRPSLGRPTYLGGTAGGSTSRTSSGIPGTGLRSGLQSRSGGSSAFFITIMVLPDP